MIGKHGSNLLATLRKTYGENRHVTQIVKVLDKKNPDGSIESKKTIISGEPRDRYISTSLMESHNLTTRISLRRYTRDTNAHSKKYRNHQLSVALYMVWYNFIREHSSLGTTPAVAAKLATMPYTLEWVLDAIESVEWMKRNDAA